MTVSGLVGGGTDVAAMAAADVLSFVEARHRDRLDAERDILQAAYQWAVLHHPDTPPATDKRGRDRAKPAGAAGTPRITEHAAAAFGARIQTSPHGARRLIADAVDLTLRLPRLRAGIDNGTVRVTHARHVADATRDLTDDEVAWVDAEVVDAADGRLAWARFEALVEGKVAAAAPELAAARERQAALERSVRKSRVNKHGNATLHVKADAPTIETIDAAIAFLAERLKERFPDACLDERRVHALALLANPDAHLDPNVGPATPRVIVYLHLYGESPIARLEGNGPVTTTWVTHLLTGTLAAGPGGIDVVNAPNVRITPVLDPTGQAPVDAYEIPARLRDAVRILHPGDVFPFAASLSRRLDLDHAIPYTQDGPTAIGNLAPLTRTHHRIKTHHQENGHGWEVRHPFPGIIIWRDPYGAHYLIDNTGTRQVTGNTPPSDRSTAPTPRLEPSWSDLRLDLAA